MRDGQMCLYSCVCLYVTRDFAQFFLFFIFFISTTVGLTVTP